MFGIAEGSESVQERTLKGIDTAWETELVPCEVVRPRYGDSPGMQAGWDSMIWWVKNVDPLLHGLDYDDDAEWELSRCLGRMVSAAKPVDDRSVVDRIKEAIRLHQATKRIKVDEFVLIDILAAMKGL